MSPSIAPTPNAPLQAGWGVPAAYRVLYPLRSSADVLAAAAALPADGQRVPWSPAAHVRWPVTFRLATRAFLLSKARTRRMVAAAGEAAVPLGAAALDSLPDELVESIVAAAAHPVAARSGTHPSTHRTDAERCCCAAAHQLRASTPSQPPHPARLIRCHTVLGGSD